MFYFGRFFLLVDVDYGFWYYSFCGGVLGEVWLCVEGVMGEWVVGGIGVYLLGC